MNTLVEGRQTDKAYRADEREAGADDEAWLAWIDELTAKGENPTASKAVDAGLAASGSTAKRYLARIRREHSERF